MLAPEVLAFVSSALPPAPARVLEVGAGNGELATALRGAGYDVVAIDPSIDSPGVRRVALLDLDEPPASFDAAVAVVSLHHVDPLAPSCERLAQLVRSGGTLIVDEFDAARFDVGSARWWLARRIAEHDGEQLEPHDVVERLRAHIHPVVRVRDALEQWFVLGDPVAGPYLHRWDLPIGMLAEEERSIDTGALAATGVRFVGVRTG